jgi:long-chain acyl-CoA synthetase
MSTHRNFVATMNIFEGTSIRFTKDDVHLSYLPLPHIMERMCFMTMMMFGASIGYDILLLYILVSSEETLFS